MIPGSGLHSELGFSKKIMFVLYKITDKCLQLIWVGILLCEWLTVSQVEVVGCACRPQAHSVHCVVHVSRDWRVVRHGKDNLYH